MTQVQLTALQMSSRPDPQDNLAIVAKLLEQLPAARPQLVVLPEAFSCFGAGDRAQLAMAEPYKDGEVQKRLAALAKKHEVYLVGGTLPVDAGERFSAASILFGPDGAILNRYDKIHLFDITLSAKKSYRESATVHGGQTAVICQTPLGCFGHTICYDLRFPHLYRDLSQSGAEILFVPAAFTKKTGEAHWHVLNRARAIENGAFVVAPCAIGRVEGGGESYGHSLIINPWGEILADGGADSGFINVNINLEEVNSARTRIPSLSHDRAFEF